MHSMGRNSPRPNLRGIDHLAMGAARDFRLQPITSSSPPLFSIAHCPDFKSRYSTERLSDQGRWRAMRWLGPTGTLQPPNPGLTSHLPRVVQGLSRVFDPALAYPPGASSNGSGNPSGRGSGDSPLATLS